MTARSSAGATFSLSAAQPATYTEAGYEALTWTEVGEVTNLGETGREYNQVTHQPLKTRGIVKLKGSFNAGSFELQFAYDSDDAGQILLRAASVDDDNYSCKILYQDGSARYFQGQVMTFKQGVGGVDDITSGTSMIEVTLNGAVDFVDVAA